MKISFVVAMSTNRVIGRQNQLPWHLPEDLKHFKTLTIGKPIVMGRKTFDSIGKPLPDRTNIVLTRTRTLTLPHCHIAHTLEEAIQIAGPADELMIIGGQQLFEAFLPRCDRIYLTLIHENFEGDSFFPDVDMASWREIQREDHPKTQPHSYAFSFITLERLIK